MSVWLHKRKGRIVGEVVSSSGEWTTIRLAEDAWADVRRRRRDPAGSEQTYRTEFLVECVEEPGGAGSKGSGEDARRDGDRSSRPGGQLGTEHQPSSSTRHRLEPGGSGS